MLPRALQLVEPLRLGAQQHAVPQPAGGLAVTIAKRVCDLAGPREVLVTRTVTDQVVATGIEFDDQGERELRGVPGHWRLFGVKVPGLGANTASSA